jgi:hypothetical protein
LIINIIGNALYALAYIANTYFMILFGRAISGLGATTLPMLMVYITNNMDNNTQKSAVGYIKYVSALTRLLGPAMGSLFTISAHNQGTVGSLFNMFTLVGWIPIIFAAVTIMVVVICFDDVQDGETKSLLHGETINNDNNKTQLNFGHITKQLWAIWMIGFMSTFIYWLYMGNSFVIATHFYSVIDNEHQLWHIYITGFVGFIAAFILFMIARELLTGIYGLIGSIFLLLIGEALYLFKPNFMFYVAVGVTTFAYGLTIPSINILNNQIVKQDKNISKNNVALSITLLTIVQSLARFVGPALFITYHPVSDNDNCNFTDPDKYLVDGCEISYYYIMSTVYIGLSAITMLAATVFMYRKIINTPK